MYLTNIPSIFSETLMLVGYKHQTHFQRFMIKYVDICVDTCSNSEKPLRNSCPLFDLLSVNSVWNHGHALSPNDAVTKQ